MPGPQPRVSDDEIRRACQTWPPERPQRELAAQLGIALITLKNRRRKLDLPPRVPSPEARAAGQSARNAREPGAPWLVAARRARSEKSRAGTLRRSPEATAKAVATTDERHPELREARPAKMRSVLRKKLFADLGPNYMKAHMKRARAANVENRFSPAWRAARSKGEKARAVSLGRNSHYFAVMKKLETATTKAALTALLSECQTPAARSLVRKAINHLGGRPQEVDREGILADLRAGIPPKQIAKRRGASLATISRVRKQAAASGEVFQNPPRD